MLTKISDRTRAMLAGSFILVAYGVMVSFLTQSKVIVMVADVVSGLSVIGAAVLLYPLFRPTGEKTAFGYLFFKLSEGLLMIVAGSLFLNEATQPIRDWIYNGIHVYAFILGSFILYYLLFKSEILPKFISIWGAAGISALLLSTLLRLGGLNYPVVDYFLALIITNEIFLAVWLMVKGIKKKAV